MVRADGIEPTTPAWKAGVLPLNYARGKGWWKVLARSRLAVKVKVEGYEKYRS